MEGGGKKTINVNTLDKVSVRNSWTINSEFLSYSITIQHVLKECLYTFT